MVDVVTNAGSFWTGLLNTASPGGWSRPTRGWLGCGSPGKAIRLTWDKVDLENGLIEISARLRRPIQGASCPWPSGLLSSGPDPAALAGQRR